MAGNHVGTSIVPGVRQEAASGICQGPSGSWGRGETPAPLGRGGGGSLVMLRSLREVILHVGDLLTLPGARPGQPHCHLRVADVSQHRVAGPGWPP